MYGIIYRIFSLFMALIPFISVSTTNFGGGLVVPYLNVSYGEEESDKMDIFVPVCAKNNEYNGVILYIHGGSWTGGDKIEWAGDSLRAARNGYIAATMNYTLRSDSNGVTAFDMLDDIQHAVEKLKEFSDEHGLNITKLATSGFSAGAHLSALYAFSRAEDSPIELVFTANRVAPSDFHPSSWDDVYRDGTAYGLAVSLSGEEITEEMIADGRAEEIINSVSPAAFICENSVPSLWGYGGADTTVPHGNAEATKAALEASGTDYTYVFYPNSTHMLFYDYESAKEYDNALYAYLKEYFGY